MRYRFGDFELDRIRGELRRGDELLPLQPKPRLLLCHLLENRDRLIPLDELIDLLWPDAYVAPASLYTCLSRLRRTLGPKAERWIRTQSKEGVCWVGPCEPVDTRLVESLRLSAADGSALVGRVREREVLLRALRQAVNGRGGLVVVHGEQGAGKTALVEMLIDSAVHAGVTCAVGRFEEEGAPPLSAWVEVLRDCRRKLDDASGGSLLHTAGPDLQRVLPEAASSAKPLDTLDVTQLEFRLADAVSRFLCAASGFSPLVVLLEDIHWADESSILALKRLVRRVPRLPLLVLVTHRSWHVGEGNPVEGKLAEMTAAYGGQRLELAALAESDTRELVERLRGRAVPEEEASRIHAESGGVPLFIEQIVRFRSPRASDALRQGHATVALPPGIVAVIGAQRDRLSERCRRMLEVAAVLGRRVDRLQLEQLWSRAWSAAAATELYEAIDEATRAGMLETVPDDPRQLRFRHALIREVGYRVIAADRRARLHWLAGVMGEERAAARPMEPATIADHLVQGVSAGSPGRARHACIRAARAAMARGAFAVAAADLQRALDMGALEAEPDLRAEAEIRVELAEALSRAGRSVEAGASAGRAIEQARRLGDPELQARAVLSCAPRLDMQGRIDEGLLERVEDALARLPPGDSSLRARLLGRVAWAIHHVPEEEERRRAVTAEAVAMARRLDDPATLAVALEDRRTTLLAPRHQDELDALIDEMIDLARRRGDDEGLVRAMVLRAWSSAARGRLEEAEDRIDEFRRRLRRIRNPETRLLFVFWRMMLSLLRGDWDQARQAGREIVDLGAAFDEAFAPLYFANMMVPEFLRGAGAVEIAQGIVALLPERPVARGHLINSLLDAGRIDEARREWQSALSMGFDRPLEDGRWLLHMVNLATAAAAFDDRERAADLYDRLLPMTDRLVLLGPLYMVAPFGATARVLGVLAASLERWADAESHFEAAEAIHRHWGARPWMATTLCDHAEMRLRRGWRGDRTAARRLLKEARALAAELDMPVLAERIAALDPPMPLRRVARS